MLASITEEYPVVFNGGRSNKPHSQQLREFSQRWGFIKTLYEIAGEKITKVGEVYQVHLNDFLQYLTYMADKREVDEAEDKFQENLRKSRKGR